MHRDRVVAWALVGVQAALLVGLVLVPAGHLWHRSGAVRAVAGALVLAGLAIVVMSAWGIRRGLSVLPLPTDSAVLQTAGPYRWCRHPIYSGVLVTGAGLALGRASIAGLALLVALVALFRTKAGVEERHLRARFPGYPEYAARTPRFVPSIRRVRTSG